MSQMRKLLHRDCKELSLPLSLALPLPANTPVRLSLLTIPEICMTHLAPSTSVVTPVPSLAIQLATIQTPTKATSRSICTTGLGFHLAVPAKHRGLARQTTAIGPTSMRETPLFVGLRTCL